jgi:uncharacterized membrane protein
MTDPQDTAPQPAPRETDKWLEAGPANALVIYVLYLLSFVVGITGLIGIVMAYINRGKAGGFVETHYTWLIRTFWIGLLYSAIAMVLAMVAIGFLLMIAVAVWAVIRLVKGVMALNKNQPIPDPLTWWI